MFLDFDGTLTEIVSHPGAVVVDAQLRAVLERLIVELPGRVAIVSGRSIDELHRLLGPMSLAFGGSHGVELLWPDGRTTRPDRPADLGPVVREFQRLQKLHTGIVVERKPFGVALHYRGEPQAERACRDLAVAVARSSGLTLQAGKMVFELRAPGADKGSALRALLDSPTMRGTRPVFIGDDDTDEAAFIASAELGGTGILVGPMRPTAARYRLESVDATLDWLEGKSA